MRAATATLFILATGVSSVGLNGSTAPLTKPQQHAAHLVLPPLEDSKARKK